MLIYLDQAWEAQRAAGRHTLQGLYSAVMDGAVERVRPKMMTVTAIIAGLLPVLWGSERGRVSCGGSRRR
jgi:Cu(I)/Ag(I) efflux system membrane protein CusA/SilA